MNTSLNGTPIPNTRVPTDVQTRSERRVIADRVDDRGRVGSAAQSITLPVVMGTKARSYPKHAEGGRAHYMPATEALTRRFPFDAHTAAYSAPSIPRRLGTDAALDLPGGIQMVAAIFDVDGEGHIATDQWWEAEKAKFFRLREDTPLFAYRTRGGYRLVGVLDEPILLTRKADAAKWKRQYLVWMAHLQRKYGIVADPACADWPRLFRLPHATREVSGKPEELETIGDVKDIGIWAPVITGEDIALAAELQRKKARARAIQVHGPVLGEGALFHAFLARAWVGPEIEVGKWTVKCPWESNHTKGVTFDSSTVLYAPGPGESLGWVHCAHTHCAGMDLRDVLAVFSPSERDAARDAAFGIVTEASGRRVRVFR